jgi:hypothetical protein
MVAQMKGRKVKAPDTVGFRFTPEDRQLVSRLQQKLKNPRLPKEPSVADVIRMGLRSLAKEEGLI